MTDYKQFVKSLADSKADRLFLNSDEEHALTVLVQLFNTAKSVVRIFAGCLCEHVGNKQEYIEAISDFIERGGKVRILLNKYDANQVRNSNLFKRLAYYISDGKDVEIKKTPVKPYLNNDASKKEVHFTVADETGYRIETDIENRTAECNFNNPVMAKPTAAFFDRIFAQPYSTSINLMDVFNGDK